MKLDFHKRVKKHYMKLRAGERKKFDERILLFEKSPFHPLLRNHALKGRHKGRRSIDITGALRAFYKPVDDDTAYFVYLDTHSNLFKK